MPEPRELHPFTFSSPQTEQRIEGDFSISYVPSDTPAHDGVAKPDPKGSSAQEPVSSSKFHHPDVPLPEGFAPQLFIIPGDKMPVAIPEATQQELPFIPAPPVVTPVVVTPPIETPKTAAEIFGQQLMGVPAITPSVKDESKIAESDMSPAAVKGNTRPKAAKSGTLPS